jgi:hypothetical protein
VAQFGATVSNCNGVNENEQHESKSNRGLRKRQYFRKGIRQDFGSNHHAKESQVSRQKEQKRKALQVSGTIAPHQGREIALILTGAKSFAVIEKGKDPDQYHNAGAIDQPGITVAYRDSSEGPEVIISRTRAAVAEYDQLIIAGVQKLGASYHRAMGQLFGYSDADINAYINSAIDCNCAKCNGVN